MDQSTALIARRAAARLGESADPHLPQQVEAVLAGADLGTPAQRFFDPATAIAAAALVVSAAGFAWQVYRDLRQDRKDAAAVQDAMARRLRTGLEAPPGVTAGQRDRIILVVVKETIAAASAGGALDALPKRERSEPLPDRRPTPGPPDEGDDG